MFLFILSIIRRGRHIREGHGEVEGISGTLGKHLAPAPPGQKQCPEGEGGGGEAGEGEAREGGLESPKTP